MAKIISIFALLLALYDHNLLYQKYPLELSFSDLFTTDVKSLSSIRPYHENHWINAHLTNKTKLSTSKGAPESASCQIEDSGSKNRCFSSGLLA